MEPRKLPPFFLNSAEFINYKSAIELVAAKLEPALKSSPAQIDMKIFAELNEQFGEHKKSQLSH